MDAMAAITDAIGVDGMAGGQVEDILAERREGDLETLEYVHSRKSGALLRASLVAGAILSGGMPEAIRSLEIYGDAIGLAFQIVDDILSETSDPPSLGKPVKNDHKRGKLTYPRLMGVVEAQKIAERKLEEGLAAIKWLGKAADPLRWIATYVLARSR
jgi:geranylgeranyl diphosphate synthase, type II